MGGWLWRHAPGRIATRTSSASRPSFLLPALALGAEPPAPGTMDAPPESPAGRLLTRALAVRTFLYFGFIEAALGLGGFVLFYVSEGWRPSLGSAAYAAFEREAMTATFLAIVGGQVGCLFAQRDGAFATRLSLTPNRLVAAGPAFALALALALVYTPRLNGACSMAPVAPPWLLLVPGSAVAFLALDALRRALAAATPARAGASRSDASVPRGASGP